MKIAIRLRLNKLFLPLSQVDIKFYETCLRQDCVLRLLRVRPKVEAHGWMAVSIVQRTNPRESVTSDAPNRSRRKRRQMGVNERAHDTFTDDTLEESIAKDARTQETQHEDSVPKDEKAW